MSDRDDGGLKTGEAVRIVGRVSTSIHILKVNLTEYSNAVDLLHEGKWPRINLKSLV